MGGGGVALVDEQVPQAVREVRKEYPVLLALLHLAAGIIALRKVNAI